MASDKPSPDTLGALATLAHDRDLAPDPRSLEALETLDGGAAEAAGPRRDEAALYEARYELERTLGVGGMGEVKLARDRRIGRAVALKTLRPGAASSSAAIARFLREARVQGQLEHPAVVPVYDVGVGPDGAAYFTMMRVQGHALDDVLEALARNEPAAVERYSRRRLLTAFAQLCLAVDYAHVRGVLHRDLKPGNVMLGDFGEVRVLDWGLAKVRGAPDALAAEALAASSAQGASVELPGAISGATPVSSDPGRFTVEGAVLGTPGYMAPEQALGRVDALDARADVYALGAILFELLTLAPLHDGRTAAERLVSTVTPGERSPAKRHPARDVPPELDDACVRALAQEPADRTPTARALGAAVERYLDGDRDLERRRALASDEAERAAERAAALASLRGDEAERARAAVLRHAAHALALDPRNARAAALLARMLVEVPDEIPAEARDEMERGRAGLRREALAATLARMVGLGAGGALFAYMGLRHAGLLALAALGLTVSTAATLTWWRLRTTRPRAAALAWWAALLGGGALVVVFCSVASPLLFVSTLSMANTLWFVLQADERSWRGPLLVGGLSLAVGYALQRLGALPGGFELLPDRLIVHAGLVRFEPWLFAPLLLFAALLTAVAPGLVLARVRAHGAALEQRLFMHSWHLRKLVSSDDGHEPSGPPARGDAARSTG